MAHAVIKVRSNVNVKGDIRDTMKLLRLHKVNHCVILPENDVYRGMLQKVKDYVTWGEVKPEVLARMMLTKGKLEGDKPITVKYIKENSDFGTPLDFAKAVVSGQTHYASIKGIKPVIRLHPPIKGYEGIKRSYKTGGALGYRGEDINTLILRMLGPEQPKPDAQKAPAKKAPAKKAPAKAAPKKPVPKKAAPKTDEKAEDKPKPKPVKKAAPKPKPAEKKEEN